MPNINTLGSPIASANNLKIFGMGSDGSVGWISSNTLDSYYNERMAEDFALLGTYLSVEELLTQRSYLIGIRNIFADTTGIWYDPQDMTTLYQDHKGTLPVYRPGTGLVDPPVGLMLDKSQGLELGPELVTNGDFSTGDLTGWSKVGSLGTQVYSDGGCLVTHTLEDVAWSARERGISGLVIGKQYLFTADIKKTNSIGSAFLGLWAGATVQGPALFNSSDSAVKYRWVWTATSASPILRIATYSGGEALFDNVSCREIKGYHAYQSTTTARPTLSGRYNILTATETLSTQSVTTVATNYTLSFSGTGTVTLSGTATGTYSAGTHTITCTAGTLALTVAGTVTRADLRVKRDGSSLPAYQSVTNANTYDTAGFPLYLRRDKVDDDLIVQAPAITGQVVWGSIDTVDIAAATIAAGAYKPFGTITAGEPTFTQWIAIDGTLTAAEQAILERYVYSKSKLPVGA